MPRKPSRPTSEKPTVDESKAAPAKVARKSPAKASARTTAHASAPRVMATPTPRYEKLEDVELAFELANQRRAAPITVAARRPDDMLVANLVLFNLRVAPGAAPTLRRIDPKRHATLVLELPPQSFGEQALLDATGPEVTAGTDDEFPQSLPGGKNAATPAEALPPLGATRIRIAGLSRLAFTMPDNITSVPYTLDALLQACRTWPMRRSLSAVPAFSTQLGRAEGGDLETLGLIVASPDFAAAQRLMTEAFLDLGIPHAIDAVIAAGQKVAGQAASSLAKADRVAAASRIVKQLRAEITALSTQFPELREAKAKAVATLAVAYQAASDIGKLGLASRPGLVYAPDLPLLPLLAAPHRPGRDVTAIELPYRVLISPIAPARWTHRSTAVALQGRNELWHTRLTTKAGDAGTDAPGSLRAIWSDDYPIDDFSQAVDPPRPFRMSLDAPDRKMLVQLMAGFDESVVIDHAVQRYTPRPARADRIILSALGGLLDAEGAWEKRPSDVDVEQWRHLTSLGRDQYVRVVYAGYLLPFGHAASLIKVTERKFEPSNPATPRIKRVATLRQRFFIVVRDPVKAFDGSYHETGGHPFPFTSVELLTRVTPNLLTPDNDLCRVAEGPRTLYQVPGVTGGLTRRQAFWPMTSTMPDAGNLRFDIAAIDRDGRRTSFSLPLLFISEVANTGNVSKGGVTRKRMRNVIDGYNADSPARRQATIGGDDICFAPPMPDADGDPRMPTDSILFRAGEVASESSKRCNTYPEVQRARVALRAAQRILGRDDAKVDVRYADIYRAKGFGSGNPAYVFLKLDDNTPNWDIVFGPTSNTSKSDSMGAVASPSMAIQGVSLRMGLAANLDQITANTFDPKLFFPNARILGGIKLLDVIAKVTTGVSGADVPKFVTRELPAGGGKPARSEARYDWKTKLATHDPDKLLLPSADGSNPSPFEMRAVTTTTVGAPGSASSTVTANIGNFKVNLFGFIVLWFRNLRFTTQQGRKPDVDVDLHPTRSVSFGGPLEFVNQVKDLLPGNGFSDPSALTVTPSGISAKYALTIPQVQVGVFAISGLSIGARFSLPFDTKPMEVGFNFAERENPFSLTVSLLGGGGFLAIGVGADGVREIEAALEAQARLGIDLGVASGSVEISAGIYFHWLDGGGDAHGLVELAGYVRLHGELDVMGVISVSLTFNLQLAFTKYEEENRAVIWGEATLIVEVEVLVFSGEVTVRCRREFVGSEADPTFVDLIPAHPTWASYCLAFAKE